MVIRGGARNTPALISKTMNLQSQHNQQVQNEFMRHVLSKTLSSAAGA